MRRLVWRFMRKLGNSKFLLIIIIIVAYFLMGGYKEANIRKVLLALDDKEKAEVSRKEDGSFDFKYIADYSGEPYVEINENRPFFKDSEKKIKEFESYAKLDKLGRCGTAFACVGEGLMPTEKRGSIGKVRPTGWQTVKYDNVDGKYLYNRCHLIGYQLTGENANERNLITGTRYLNVEGMLPFENLIADYVKETENHVLYRVTPVFVGNNLVAHGVLMEALSLEDEGEGVSFCVFVYNVQPGISINYKNGKSKRVEKK